MLEFEIEIMKTNYRVQGQGGFLYWLHLRVLLPLQHRVLHIVFKSTQMLEVF